MSYQPGFFKDKKITVMGLGLLGGIGDVRFLAQEGADLIVTDLKSEADAAEALALLRNFPNVKFTLGRHDLEDFRGRDLIVKAPSTPLDSPYIAEARKEGTQITMWAALFSKFALEMGAKVVGITGTRGKTTTTELIVHMLKAAGKDVIEGGNVRGTSILSRLPALAPDIIIVLELDSWKLQGFGEEKISPNVAVFTNFLPDHQNYYKNDMDAYFADKANIFRYQKEGDTLVMGKDLWNERRADIEGKTAAQIVVADPADIPAEWHLSIPGEHNKKNAACALRAVEALGIDIGVLQKAAEEFSGVEGRLELAKEYKGVKIYNDTTSTTPDAALAGLEALAKNRNAVLVMGGADKNLSMAKLVQSLDFYCKQIVLLPGTGTDKLKDFGFESVQTPVARAATLEEAFSEALEAAKPGDIILFSPAFASFGMFKNEYDRGEKFMKLVAGLI